MNKNMELQVEAALARLRERIKTAQERMETFNRADVGKYLVNINIREPFDLRGKTYCHTTTLYSEQLKRALLRQMSRDVEDLQEKLATAERDKHLPSVLAFLRGVGPYSPKKREVKHG